MPLLVVTVECSQHSVKFSRLVEIAEDQYYNADDQPAHDGQKDGGSLAGARLVVAARSGLESLQAEGRAELVGPGERLEAGVSGVLRRAHHLHPPHLRMEGTMLDRDKTSISTSTSLEWA